MEIEIVSIDELMPYAKNSRTHSDEQIAQIAASIGQFGFNNPVLIDEDGVIIAGHGRVLAAKRLAMTEVPCIRLEHLNDAQKRAYVIADNKLALNSGWNAQLLALELHDLQEMGVDLRLTGFSGTELKTVLLGQSSQSEASFADQEIPERLLVIVECKTDQEQRLVLEKLTREGHECRALTS